MTHQPDPRASGGGPHLDGEELSAHLDGALSKRRSGDATEHLASCERCRGQLAALLSVKAAMGSLGEAEPAPGWLPGVSTLFAGGSVPPPRLSHRSRHAVQRRVVIAGAVAAAGVFGLLLTPPPPAPVSFRQEVRQHLVLIDEPTTDQSSYVVEAGNP
jgi:anti-sigma factor RsiW